MRAIRNKTALVLFFAGLIIAINQAYSQSYQPGAAQHGSAINGDASPENRDFSSPVPAESSPPASATPAPESAGLIIRATFDASITTRPNAAAIEAAVNRAIAFYQFLFRDPVTVSILFRYAATEPDGTPISGNFVSRSNYVIYHIPWNTYLAQLRADARTGYDSSADASLPPSPLSANIVLTSANGRAVALDTPAAMFANGAVASGGPFDGIVTVSPNKPVQFTRPVAAGAYDGQRFIEHEIDEVLGLGSYLDEGTTDLRPQDLFSWMSAGQRNVHTTGTRYFSIDSGTTNLVSFNQNPAGDHGDWLSPACPQSVARVQYAFSCPGTSVDVTAGSAEGIDLDVIGYDLAAAENGLLANISTRLSVGTGDNVLIGGFIIGGSGGKQLLLRALGPTLAHYGVNNVLQDPFLELHNSSGGLIVTNNNWGQAANALSIPPGMRPPNGAESAIFTTLNPGSYTAVVRGVNNTTGTALVEVYDMTPSAPAHLTNISTRGFVQTDPDVMIAGTIVQSNNKRVIIRALGPTLASEGVANPLSDPALELHNANGALLAANDNWRGTQQAEIMATGYAPPSDLEPAITRVLAPGNYTAIVRGTNNTTGTALIEIYVLQ